MKTILYMVAMVFLFASIGCQNNANTEADASAQDSTSVENKPTLNQESTENKYVGEWESVASENLGNGTFATRYFLIVYKKSLCLCSKP